MSSINFGCNYFSHDTDMYDDPKSKHIIRKHGLAGYGFLNILLEKIHKNGSFKKLTSDDLEIYAYDLHVDVLNLESIIKTCVDKDFFNKSLFDEYGILTSRRIQRNYVQASLKKKYLHVTRKYLLINPKDYIAPGNKIIIIYDKIDGESDFEDNESNFTNSESDFTNSESDFEDNESTTSVTSSDFEGDKSNFSKQTKLNKIKLNKKIRNEDKTLAKIKFSDFVTLTQEEHQKLIDEHGETTTLLAIEKLNNYKGSSGKEYKSDYLAMKNWVFNEIKKNVNSSGKKNGKYTTVEALENDVLRIAQTLSGESRDFERNPSIGTYAALES